MGQVRNQEILSVDHSYHLTYQFISENPTWAISSLISYCHTYYDASYSTISHAIRNYIDSNYTESAIVESVDLTY